jgi:hypothetical protein
MIELCGKKETAPQEQTTPATPSSAPAARQQQASSPKQAYSADYDDEIPF